MIAAGDTIATLAIADARLRVDGDRLSGRLAWVIDAQNASLLLVAAQEGLFALEADAPLQRVEQVRQDVRDLLRHGGYKPTGRGKPASEYLVRAATADLYRVFYHQLPIESALKSGALEFQGEPALVRRMPKVLDLLPPTVLGVDAGSPRPIWRATAS